MHFRVQVRLCVAYALFLCSSLWFTIAWPLSADWVGDASNELSDDSLQVVERSTGFPQLFKNSNSSGSVGATDLSFTNRLGSRTFIWEITDVLSLTINPGHYHLPSEKVLATLSAASVAVGKKPAAALLEQKFTQKTGSIINRMIFEIEPDPGDMKLTWADVGEVLGENGLSTFFRQEQYWYNTDFEVVDDVRGRLGEGALRRWYQLGDGNDTAAALAADDIMIS